MSSSKVTLMDAIRPAKRLKKNIKEVDHLFIDDAASSN